MIPIKPEGVTWTDEQWEAIYEDNKNIIVSAGAGSGKTAVLTERVIRKLKDGIFLLTTKEIDKNKNMPSMDVYTRRFGGIKNAYKMIGIDFDDFNDHRLKQCLIKEYLEMADRIGKTPTIYEYDKFGRIRSSRTVSKIFGGFNNFQKICGLELNPHNKKKYDQDVLINGLLTLYKELGRVPTQNDINNCGYIPSSCTYFSYFGGIKEALRLIGIKEEYTECGTKCLSRYEYLFARTLELKNIKFEKEVSYRKYIPNLKEWWRFDFEVIFNNDCYLVEIFGIENNIHYERKMCHKQKICLDNNIKLISITPEDILYKNYDQIYDMFIYKIRTLDDEIDEIFE